MKKKNKPFLQALFLTLFAVFLAHWLSDVLGIEALTSAGAFGWIVLFVWYFIFVFVGLKIFEKFL